ncbi:hypothetical protein ACJX0J_016172, partial [Zea mays]
MIIVGNLLESGATVIFSLTTTFHYLVLPIQIPSICAVFGTKCGSTSDIERY